MTITVATIFTVTQNMAALVMFVTASNTIRTVAAIVLIFSTHSLTAMRILIIAIRIKIGVAAIVCVSVSFTQLIL